jgi:hypothetical protein
LRSPALLVSHAEVVGVADERPRRAFAGRDSPSCLSSPAIRARFYNDEDMKHVTYANKSLLMDDEAADLLAEYAAALGSHDQADAVKVRAVSDDGNDVEATIVLNASSDLIVESTNSAMEPPINEEIVAYMRDAILRLTSPAEVQPHEDSGTNSTTQYVDDF